jgi:hypothetical protein
MAAISGQKTHLNNTLGRWRLPRGQEPRGEDYSGHDRRQSGHDHNHNRPCHPVAHARHSRLVRSAAQLCPNCGRHVAAFGVGSARVCGHTRNMPLQLHTRPDPSHSCETCGGPCELVSQTITPCDGSDTPARELSPAAPRCANPSCRSRRPLHRRRETRAAAGH